MRNVGPSANTDLIEVLRAFGQNLIDQHPLGEHRCGTKRWLIKCPPQVLGESVLAALPTSEAAIQIRTNPSLGE